MCESKFLIRQSESIAIASKFVGSGTTIYLMSLGEWRTLIGDENQAEAVYFLLGGMRACKGAVPKNIDLPPVYFSRT